VSWFKGREVFLLGLVFFVLIHLFLFNINAAEWGDSYRILRAAQFVKNGTYPDDEKRPPLFSIILATNPSTIEPVVWARGVMFVFSVGSFIVFLKLLSLFFPDMKQRFKIIGVVLFTLNPVFLYWSVRVMADVPFSFLALLAVYTLMRWKKGLSLRSKDNPFYYVVLGFIAALSVLMRFEGFLLTISVLLGLVFPFGVRSVSEFSLTAAIKGIFGRAKGLFAYLLAFAIALIPYIMYRNPLSSKYFAEPAHRTYDFKTVLTYAASLLFIFGLTSAFFFVYASRKSIREFLSTNVAVASFLFLELLLILLWPAAIPRLFTAIVPFAVIILSLAIAGYFGTSSPISDFLSGKLEMVFITLALLVIYAISIFALGLQFLVIAKYSFMLIVLLQLINIYALTRKNFNLFGATLFVSLVVWSFSVIWVHKDIFKVVNEAGKYAATLSGRIAYNDVSAVTPWNLGGKGVFIDVVDKKQGTYEKLKEENIAYVLVTNEHNPELSYDLTKRPYLELVKKFEADINGSHFFTVVARVK